MTDNEDDYKNFAVACARILTQNIQVSNTGVLLLNNLKLNPICSRSRHSVWEASKIRSQCTSMKPIEMESQKYL